MLKIVYITFFRSIIAVGEQILALKIIIIAKPTIIYTQLSKKYVCVGFNR